MKTNDQKSEEDDTILKNEETVLEDEALEDDDLEALEENDDTIVIETIADDVLPLDIREGLSNFDPSQILLKQTNDSLEETVVFEAPSTTQRVDQRAIAYVEPEQDDVKYFDDSESKYVPSGGTRQERTFVSGYEVKNNDAYVNVPNEQRQSNQNTYNEQNAFDDFSNVRESSQNAFDTTLESKAKKKLW